MRKLKQEQILSPKIRSVIFFFVFCGYSCLFSHPFVEADPGKKIKIHPKAVPNSLRSTEALKAKAEAYNNEAIALFEEGRYAEAQELWEKAIKLMEHPRAQDIDFETVGAEQPAVEKPETSVMNGESLETSPIADKYQAGLSLLEQKEYGEAKRVFQEIDAMQPDYRNTKRYLAVIDELLREEDSPTEQESMSDEAQEQVVAGREEYPEVATETQRTDTALEFDQRQEEAQWEEAVGAAEQKLLDQIAERVEPVYQKALQQYKNKDYTQARRSFEEVQVLSPDYKLTAKYLDGIDDDILYAQQQKEEEQRLAEERSRRQDELEFRKTIAAKEAAYRKELTGQAEEIYQQAIDDFKSRRFEEAEDNFRKVETMASGYKLTGKYLARIQDARDDEARLQAEEDARRQALMQHNEEEDMKRTIEESERMRQQGLRERAEVIYQKARADYGQGEMEKARAGFSEVEQILPGYRSARKYLTLIDDRASEQKPELEVSPQSEVATALTEEAKRAIVPASRKRLEAEELYQQAKESYKKREFVKAKELFEKVNIVVRDYQATEKFLARIDSDIQQEARYQQDLQRSDAQRQAKKMRYQQDLQRREAQRQARGKALEQKRAAAKAAAARRRQEAQELKDAVARIKSDRDQMVASKVQELYREAESDYASGLYALAKERFNEVQRISPGYRSTEEYLGNIAYKYGSEAAVATTPVPLRLEQQALPVPATTPVPVIQEQAVSHPNAVVAPKIAEFDDAVVADYDAGVLLFKQKQYARAREKFEYVIQADPGHKSASKYLGRIDSLLQEEQQQLFEKEQQILARAMRSEKRAQKKVSVAAIPPPPIEVKNPEPKEATAAPVEASASAVLDKELPSKAQELSSQVEQKRALREKERQERQSARRAAKEKAAQILAQRKQSKIQRAEERKHQRLLTQTEKTYAQALAAYAKKDLIGAKQKFVEVEKLSANFKETAQYLIRIDADIAAKKQKPTEVAAAPIYVQPQGIAAKEQTRKKAEEFFREALRLYASQKIVPAREKFQEAEKLVSGYKTTEKYIRLTDRAILRQQEKESRTKQAQDARGARLEANAQKVREKTEKVNQARETDKIKQRIAQMEKEAATANKRGQWDAAEQKLSGIEGLLETGPISAADKQQVVRRVSNLRSGIAAGRDAPQKEQLEQAQTAQQKQDERSARLATNEQKKLEKAEKLHQEKERKQQAQAKRIPASAPATRPVWVDPPNFDDLELTEDVGALRRQYAQIQKKRKGVQGAIRVRLDQTYAQAVRLYNQGYYAGAKNLFQEIVEVQPSFNGTKNYLTQIDQKLAKLPASAIMPGKEIEAPSVYVKPRARVVTDALDTLEAPRQ